MKFAPDAEWRAILARFAGLRPSEILESRITDVKWDRGLLVVRSQKTEHHTGGGMREVPIFRELRPYLLDVCEQADAGAVYVLERLRKRSVGAQLGKKINLGKILCDILEKAGVQKWGKPFVSLRSSCETDLAGIYPLHVVTSWLGNSPCVVQKHYLKVLPEHFEKATKAGLGKQKTESKVGAAREKTEKMTQTGAKGTTENPRNPAPCASDNNEAHQENAPDSPSRTRTAAKYPVFYRV